MMWINFEYLFFYPTVVFKFLLHTWFSSYIFLASMEGGAQKNQGWEWERKWIPMNMYDLSAVREKLWSNRRTVSNNATTKRNEKKKARRQPLIIYWYLFAHQSHPCSKFIVDFWVLLLLLYFSILGLLIFCFKYIYFFKDLSIKSLKHTRFNWKEPISIYELRQWV